jgi:hypothetical protein
VLLGVEGLKQEAEASLSAAADLSLLNYKGEGKNANKKGKCPRRESFFSGIPCSLHCNENFTYVFIFWK